VSPAPPDSAAGCADPRLLAKTNGDDSLSRWSRQGPEFVPSQGMGARRAVLDPAAEPSQCGLENPCLTLLGQHQRRGIGAGTLAPTPGKELEPLSCAARPELNTIAERTNIFAGARFDFVKSGRAFRLTFARARSMITIHLSRCRQARRWARPRLTTNSLRRMRTSLRAGGVLRRAAGLANSFAADRAGRS
jgi:hypothetical protein